MKPAKMKRRIAGFTLLEVLIAAMLIGLAIVALSASSGAFTMYNAAGVDLSTSEFLIEEIREMTSDMPITDPTTEKTGTIGSESGETLSTFDDVCDFNGQSYNPPIDAGRNSMSDFSAYAQSITVENVTTASLTTTAAAYSTNLYKVTVAITKNGQTVNSASWIRTKH